MADGIDDGSAAFHTIVATPAAAGIGQAVLGRIDLTPTRICIPARCQGAKRLSQSPESCFHRRLISTPYFLST